MLDYDKTFCIEETGVFQHYSIDTSNCVRSIASKCAPYDVTGVDLSTISAVPCEGEAAAEGRHEHVDPPAGYLYPPRDPAGAAPGPGETAGTSPPVPGTPLTSPREYGCDFASVTCSTPYTDLDKTRKFTSARENIRAARMRFFDANTDNEGTADSPDSLAKDDATRYSSSSGIGSLGTPFSSEESRPCDQHHSNCACGIIGHLSPPITDDPSGVESFCNLDVSYYDNVILPKSVNPSQKKPSPKIPRDQYQSSESLEKETALLRGLQTL